MVGFIGTLVFASIFLQGEAVVTDNLTSSNMFFVYDDVKDSKEVDRTLFAFLELSTKFRAEVYVKDTETRPITILNLCNKTFTRYTAILWPQEKKTGIWGYYLDNGEWKKQFKGKHPFIGNAGDDRYNVWKDQGRAFNVYGLRGEYHVRFTVAYALELTYDGYLKYKANYPMPKEKPKATTTKATTTKKASSG